ncbi:helix-turn-helix domain-containing protein [Klebsiella indica]|uniref:helix-turn-helix domain-containing protein n=1 Tax=Klebsiella TaxID=570 RepID=UPI0031B6F12B
MLSNKETITKYEHNDVEQEKFFKSYHNIYNIYTIYSPDIETGEMKFSLQMKTIYSYLLSWQENGLTCYQNQEDLAKMCDMSRQRFVEMTSKMQKAGILKKEKIEGRRNKELIALPITDSHINPPDAIPQVVIEESAQSDTEALSDDVEECPFFTTSEEAYQDELDFDSLPVATTHTKRVNSDMEPLSNIFINYLSEGGRLTNESFAEFARRVFEDTDNKYPAGFEIYFSKSYPKIYEEFELPF